MCRPQQNTHSELFMPDLRMSVLWPWDYLGRWLLTKAFYLELLPRYRYTYGVRNARETLGNEEGYFYDRSVPFR